ncbi:hypothetical protein GCM10022251_32940 [Phytohabitans flavus]
MAVLAWADRVRPLLFDGSPLLPSAVCVDADGELLTGRDALHAARSRPESAELHPKRCLDHGTVLLGSRELPVTDVIAAVLRRVLAEATRTTGGDVPPVVLTYPAGWGRQRRAILVEAAVRAGMEPVGLVAEPVAAASYFATAAGLGLGSGETGLVYDFGAGTLDITLMRQDGDRATVLASGGLPESGGLDIDAAVFAYFGRLLADRDRPLWSRLANSGDVVDRRARLQLWADIRSAKESLARTATSLVPVPLFDDDLPLGREKLEDLAKPVLDLTVREVRAILRSASLSGPPQRVFLVGGACRMPLVATTLHRALGVAPVLTDQPEMVVAEGALHAEVETPIVPVADPEPSTVEAPPPSVPEPTPSLPPPTEEQANGGQPAAVAMVVLAVVVVAVLLWWSAGNGRRPVSGPPTTAPPTASAQPSSAATAPVIGRAAGDSPAVAAGLIGYSNLRFRPGDGNLLAGSHDGRIVIWNIASAKVAVEFAGFPGDIQELAFSPDGRLLAASGKSTEVWVWDIAKKRRIANPVVAPPTGNVGVNAAFFGIDDIAFAPDGKWLLVKTGGRVERWETRGFTRQGIAVEVSGRGIVNFRLGDNGRIGVGNVTDYKTFYVWNMAGPSVIKRFDLPYYSVPAVQPNGTLVAIAAADGISLWDTTSRRQVATVPVVPATSTPDIRVEFSPNGKYLWTHAKGVSQLWDVATRRPLVDAFAGPAGLDEARFSADSRFLALGSFGGAQVWDLSAVLANG